MKSFEKAFITGCDKNTEWMLEWFIKNYRKHNDTPIIFMDFGVSRDMYQKIKMMGWFEQVVELNLQGKGGWFYKPQAMMKSPAKKTIWLDTDIHVLGDISGAFNYIKPEMLTMVEDVPWSKRRGGTWHNSGVVGFEGTPQILRDWYETCKTSREVGDQEVLHTMMIDPIYRIKYIYDLPHKYNWLRLDLLDGNDSPNKLCMHWTGHKGKLQIQKLIYNETV